jgi:PAS domain-containing protein
MNHAQLAQLMYSVPADSVPPLLTVASALARGSALEGMTEAHGEALLKLTLPNIGLGFAMGDRIVAINRFHANLLGYRVEEMVGHSINEWIVGPRRVLPPRFMSGDYPLRHRNGNIVRVHAVSFPILTPRTDRMVIVEPLG